MSDSPFKVVVYDKNLGRCGGIGDPLAVTATPRHNLLGDATVVLRADHPRAGDVLADGSRMVIQYDGGHAIGGPVRVLSAKGPRDESTITVTVEDDWRLMTRVLAWPVPGAALNAQSVAYDVRTGPAETIAKQVIAANTARLGLPVTVAPSLGRGPVRTIANRFHPLADRVGTMLDAAGLGLTVRQVGTQLVVDVYEPQTHPRALTEASGVVQEWTWNRTGPGMTRGVAGNQGEAAARTFRGLVDAGREAAWGDVIETFLDARDTDDAAETEARLAELIGENGPTAGLAVKLAETSTFRYGTAVQVGDRVALQVGPGLAVTDVLREVVLSWTKDNGLLVTPTVGEQVLPEAIVPRAVKALARTLRSLTRS